MFINNYFGEYFILFSIFLSINLPPSLNPFFIQSDKATASKTSYYCLFKNHFQPSRPQQK